MVGFKALSSIMGIVGILSFVGMAQPVSPGFGDFLNVNQNIFLLSCPIAGVKDGLSKARALLARDTMVVIRADVVEWRITDWDSNPSPLSSVYTYDERGRVIEQLFDRGSWRVINEYDAVGVLAICQKLDSTMHVWKNLSAKYTVRAPAGDSIFVDNLFWDTLQGDWDTSKTLSVVNQDSTSSNYSHVVMTIKNWDTLSHSWATANHYTGTSTYTNNNGQITEVTIQGKESLSRLWRNSLKILYTFNFDGTTQGYVCQRWDYMANTWKNFYKLIYTYASISVGVNNKTALVLPKATISAYWQNGTIRIIGSNNKSIKDVALFNGTGRCITNLSSNQSVFDFKPSLRVTGNSIYFLKIRTSSGEQIIKVNGIK